MQVLDHLLAEHMNPHMKAAGFSRVRRRYLLESEAGNAVFVQVRPCGVGALCFHVEWAAIPQVLREFHQRDGGKESIDIFSGLFATRLGVPEHLRWDSLALHLWAARYEASIPAFMAGFESVLRDDAIPRWHSCLNRDYLLTAEQEDPDVRSLRFGGKGGPIWTPLLLKIDDGDPVELAELLRRAEQLPRSGELVTWLRHRRGARAN